MSNRTEARSAKAARMYATGRLPLLRLFSTPLINRIVGRIARPVCNRKDWLASKGRYTMPQLGGSK